MRKNAIVITSLLLTGSLLLSACANNSNNESSSANNAAAGSNSTNVEATTAPEIVPAGALSEPFTATDLSKLPAVVKTYRYHYRRTYGPKRSVHSLFSTKWL